MFIHLSALAFLRLSLVFCFSLLVLPLRGDLLHRWSLNVPAGAVPAGTELPDSIGGARAVVRGINALATGTALTLPGTTTSNQSPATVAAYLDLPNGLISARTDLTVELWATPVSHQTFQRLLDFGRVVQAGDGLGAPGEITGLSTTAPGSTQASDSLTLTLSRSSLDQQRLEAKLNGVIILNDADGRFRQGDTSLATPVNTAYHYALVFADGIGAFGATGGRLSWYRDGVLASSVDVGFRLRDVEDVNNWIGRSLWSGDRMANATIDEVRIHDVALSPADLALSRAAGPDATLPLPVAQPDAATLHPGQKVRLAVLANDTGQILTGSVRISQPPALGTATVDAKGTTILYTHPGGATGPLTFTYTVGGLRGRSAPATVTITPATALRVTPPVFNVPAQPPATALQLVNALPGLTFAQPLALVSPPGDTRRLFVVEKTGAIKRVPDTTAATPVQSTFLNLATVLSARGESLNTLSELGLLGLAFHPAYATNRQFYVFYSASKAGSTYERVSRFLASESDPALADPASELILIDQLDQANNHNGGGLAFGPDGYLYISLGDEGGQNDQFNNGQRINLDFFSALARIDVDKKPGSLAPNPHPAVPRDGTEARYAIPPDNPWVGATAFNGIAVDPATVRTEFWAVGFRNPWRFSFDATTGDLWCADVGQSSYERIDLVVRGGNYGWPFREGSFAGPKAASAPAGFTARIPLYEYTHGNGTFQGRSVTGGLVYRGTRIPTLTGRYLFGDYVSGHIWSLRRNATGAPTVERIAGEGGIVAFGIDPANGDALLADINGSRILRLVGNDLPDSYPAQLSATGLFADLADLSPAPGVLPYEPNLTFWSDHARKRRWFTLPDDSARFTWRAEETWDAPAGTIWIKHFDMEMTRGEPSTRRRLETRLLVRNTTGSYGVSYRWNDAQTEATLVPTEGVSFPLTINEGGIFRTQTWEIPSRASCLTCHSPQAGHALSFNTRQLNRTGAIHGFAGNQIELLQQAGYFDPSAPPPPVNTLPRHVASDDTSYPLDTRARAYLAVNCAYCHFPGGTAPTAWDSRASVVLAHTGLVNGAVGNNQGNPANRLIAPGDALRSVVLQRTAAANGFTRMPPLATAELDQSGINLLTAWIGQDLAARESYDSWRLARFGSGTTAAGASAADPDGDGVSNWAEYLAGTSPLDGASLLQPRLDPSTGTASLEFTVSADRSFRVEVSTDLANWSTWDVPGNDGLPRTAGLVRLTGPMPAGGRSFFRVRLAEN